MPCIQPRFVFVDQERGRNGGELDHLARAHSPPPSPSRGLGLQVSCIQTLVCYLLYVKRDREGGRGEKEGREGGEGGKESEGAEEEIE